MGNRDNPVDEEIFRGFLQLGTVFDEIPCSPAELITVTQCNVFAHPFNPVKPDQRFLFNDSRKEIRAVIELLSQGVEIHSGMEKEMSFVEDSISTKAEVR